MEMWVNVNSFPVAEAFFAGYGNFGTNTQAYQLGTLGSTFYFSNWGVGVFGPQLQPGVCYHVAVTNTGSTVTLYLNGAAVASGSLTIATPTNTQLDIGRIPGVLGDGRKLNGLVDELTIYSRALTPAEIQAIFNAGIAGKCKPNTTVTVTNTNDSGAGSLRSAITTSNTIAGASTIAFNIPGSGVRTISVTSALPIITHPVTIDGATQPGFAGSPLIELNGNSAQIAEGLDITAGNSTVKGLVINRLHFSVFGGTGIRLRTNGGNTIEGNFIGTNAQGSATLPNLGDGIEISSSNNTIGGTSASQRNIISGNTVGVRISFTTLNRVLGNYIGTDVTGSVRLGNTSDGVSIDGFTNTVGGASTGARNVISGNNGYGVALRLSSSSNVVQGNFIGTNAAGTGAMGNGLGGVATFNGLDNAIGGTDPARRARSHSLRPLLHSQLVVAKEV